MNKLIIILLIFANLFSEEKVQIVNATEIERSLFQRERMAPPFYKEAFLRIIYHIELSNGSTINLVGVWYDLISRSTPEVLNYSENLLTKCNSFFIEIGDELIINKRKFDKNNIYTKLWEWDIEHDYHLQLYREGQDLETFMGNFSN